MEGWMKGCREGWGKEWKEDVVGMKIYGKVQHGSGSHFPLKQCCCVLWGCKSGVV